MIMKFDHISVIEERRNRESLLEAYGIENLFFKEIELKNLNIKKCFMQNWQENHDLYFFTKKGELPTELIFYDTVEGKTDIVVKENVIYGEYRNKDKAFSFLQKIFGEGYKIFQEGKKLVCNLRGVLDKQDVWLVLTPVEVSKKTYLDESGYGAIALLTSSLYHGNPEVAEYTEYETLRVNNKNLNICFVRSDEINIIFELIMLER